MYWIAQLLEFLEDVYGVPNKRCTILVHQSIYLSIYIYIYIETYQVRKVFGYEIRW